MELLKMPTMLSLSIVRTSIKVILIALLYWSVHQKATPVNVSNACLFVIALQLSVLGTVVRFSVSMVLTSKRNTKVSFLLPLLSMPMARYFRWQAARATTEEDFNKALAEMEGIDPRALQWLL